MRQPLVETKVFEYKVLERQKANLPEGVLLRMGGLGQRIDEENQNGRVYSESLWDKVLSEEKFWDRVKTREMLGEADHPEDGKTSIPRVSHLVTTVERRGTEIWVEFEVLNTPTGQIVETLVNAGARIGISSRGTGSVVEREGRTYVDESDFELETWDIVTNPSTRGAYPQRLESVREDNAKLVLSAAERLCDSETSLDRLREVKGIVADLTTEQHAPQRQMLLETIESKLIENTLKETDMAGLNEPNALKEAVSVVNDLAEAKSRDRVEAAEKKISEKDAQIADMAKEMKRLQEQSRRLRRRGVSEQDDEEEFPDAEIVDSPQTLEVDGIVTIIPNADLESELDDEELEMPEERRRIRRKAMERKRAQARRKQLERRMAEKKKCKDKDKDKKRGKKLPMESRRIRRPVRSEGTQRQLLAAKRVIERQAKELVAAKRIIEQFAKTSVSKRQYEKARQAVAKTLQQRQHEAIKQYVFGRIREFSKPDQKRLLQAVGKVRSLPEAKQRLEGILGVVSSRKTGKKRRVTEREPLPGQRGTQLTERAKPALTQSSSLVRDIVERVNK